MENVNLFSLWFLWVVAPNSPRRFYLCNCWWSFLYSNISLALHATFYEDHIAMNEISFYSCLIQNFKHKIYQVLKKKIHETHIIHDKSCIMSKMDRISLCICKLDINPRALIFWVFKLAYRMRSMRTNGASKNRDYSPSSSSSSSI